MLARVTAVVASILSAVWLARAPDWEPGIALLTFLSGYLGIEIVHYRKQKQKSELSSEHQAMKDKNPELETKNTLLASQLEAAQREIQRLTLPANQKQYKDRPEVEDRILQIVAASEPIIDTELEKQLGIGHQLAKHHVGELSRADMIDTEATFDNHSHWELTDQGRAYLAERDLLK